VLGAIEAADEAKSHIEHVKKALVATPSADPRIADEARALEARLLDIIEELSGDPVRGKRNEPTPPSISDRVQGVVYGHWYATSDATRTHRASYEIAAARFKGTLAALRTLVEVDLARLEDEAEAAGAPWTPGRIPLWSGD
jgi:hypothetical protein